MFRAQSKQSNNTSRREEPLVLQELSNQQLESALKWLASPLPEPPPQELPRLTQVEWYLLERLLHNLLEERQHSPLQ